MLSNTLSTLVAGTNGVEDGFEKLAVAAFAVLAVLAAFVIHG